MKTNHACKCISVLFIPVFFLSIVRAEKPEMKFGKIDKKDLEMEVYNLDTNANAVILGDIHNIKIKYDQQNGFQVNYYRHTRIKIFNQNGYDWANKTVRYYESSSVKEQLGSIRGFTYYLENGKVEKVKMTRESEFQEELSENWHAHRFALPAVCPGAVIEYSYRVTSNYLTRLPDWQYQYKIPVAYSEIRVEIPEYFSYKQLSRGYEPITVREQSGGRDTYSYSTTTSSRFGSRETSTQQRSYSTEIFFMATENIPAFVEEPMITSVDDYISSVSFELAFVKFPGEPIEQFTNTWESINETLMESEKFGLQLRGGVYMNADVAPIKDETISGTEKMDYAVNLIKSKITWNGENSMYPDKTLRNSYLEGVGNAADLNLNLVLMLQKAGLDANPVIISTRSNGILDPYHPLLTKFNYVIARVKIDDRVYLLDATEKTCPNCLIPVRCLNGQGRLISDDHTDWVNLENQENCYDVTCMASLVLDHEGNLSGKIQKMHKGYAAYLERRSIKNAADPDEYLKEMQTEQAGLEITDHTFKDIDSVNKPMIYSLDVNITNRVMASGDHLYLNPMLFEQMEENPFKLKERKYPVDYAYPIRETFILNLRIPENYEIEEIPPDVKLAMPGESAAYTYIFQPSQGTLQLVSKLEIRKSVFYYDEYVNLKKFYESIVEKHSEPIVLRRRTIP